VLLSIAQPFVALAETSAPAPLPPAAQEALDKGIIAAKVPDYPLAIRYFEDARKLAPEAPVIYLNLGIAESKMAGRELRAIAWFGAYLAASPDAPNAAAVKEQIAVLDVRNQSNISRLIKSVQEAAGQIPGNMVSNLADVAALWAKAGDIVAAMKVADLCGEEKDRAFREIAPVQVASGDIAGAQKTADIIQSTTYKGRVQLIIAKAQVEARDVAGAKATLQSALATADRSPDYSYDVMGDIAEAQAAIGDIAGAQKTADHIRRPFFKRIAQSAIAKAQVRASDIAGAQKTLTSAQMTAALVETGHYQNIALFEIAQAQAAIGDIASAQKSAGPIKSAYYKESAEYKIAEAQIKSGDIAGALKSMALVEKFDISPLQRAIAEAKTKTGIAAAPDLAPPAASDPQPTIRPVTTASDWLKSLDDGPLNAEPLLDLAGYLKSLPSSDDPQKVFDGLRATATKIVDAQIVVHQMLKRQAVR